VAGLFSFNIIAFPGPSCLSDRISHEGRLVLYTMIPILVIVLMVGPGAIALWLGGNTIEPPRKRRIIQAMVRPVQVWLFLIYPLLVYQTLSNFNCQHLSLDHKGTYLLMSNYNIECPLRNPGGFIFLWSLFFGVLYAAGIPILFIGVLIYYEVPHLAADKRLDEVTAQLISMFQKRHARDFEALASLCAYLTRTQPGLAHSFDILTVRACCPALYREVSAELGGVVDRQGLADWLQRRNALCIRKPLLRALVNAHSSQGLLDQDAFTEVICRMVQENVLFEGSETFTELSDDQLKRLLAVKWHASLTRVAPSEEKAKLVRQLSSQPSYGRLGPKKTKAEPEPREVRAVSVASFADSVHDFDVPSDESPEVKATSPPLDAGWTPLPHGAKQAKEKRKDMEEGVRGSLWAFEGVPRERLEQRFVEMIKKLEVIGVLSRENLSWGGGGPREELAIAHLGFLFRNYRAGVWYWEVVELIRKLTFNALMVFIFPGSRAQLICGFLIAVFFMLASARFSPQKDKRVATLHFVASVALSVTLLYAICIRLMEQGPSWSGESGLREFLSWLSIILIWTVPAFPLVMFVFNSDANPFIVWNRITGGHKVEHSGELSPSQRPLRLTLRTDGGDSPLASRSPVALQRRALPPSEPIPPLDEPEDDQVLVAEPAMEQEQDRVQECTGDSPLQDVEVEEELSIGGSNANANAAAIAPQQVPGWFAGAMEDAKR